jgi:hypothetical protein
MLALRVYDLNGTRVSSFLSDKNRGVSLSAQSKGEDKMDKDLKSGKPEEIGLDLLWGMSSIAEELGLNRRQAYYLLESGVVAGARKVGGRWCASRSGLRRNFAALLAGNAAKWPLRKRGSPRLMRRAGFPEMFSLGRRTVSKLN